MIRNGNPPGKNHVNSNQIVLQSKLRVSQSGIEMLDFVIPLGVVELHCSCPIPDEGTEGSPVYVHIKPAHTPRPRRRPDAQARGGNGAEDEQDEDWGNRAPATES